MHQSLALVLDTLSAETGDAAQLDEAIAAAVIARDYYVGQGEPADTYDGWIADMRAIRATLR